MKSGVVGVLGLVLCLLGLILFQTDGKQIRLPDSNAVLVNGGVAVFVKVDYEGVWEAYRCPVEKVKAVVVTDKQEM